MHLRHAPDDERREHGGQEEARDAPECGFRDGDQGAFDVVGFALSDRLQRADVAGDEGEDGDADAALEEDADDGPLEQTGG